MSTVGDLSAMYDKEGPGLACDKDEEAISHGVTPDRVGRKEASLVAEHVISGWPS